MQEFVLFILTFLLVLVMYEIFIVRRAKPGKERKGKKAREAKEPVEVTYLVKKYKLDLEKVNYNRLLQVVAVTSSFDIALVVSLILFLKIFILEIIVGFLCTLIVIFVSYHIVYLIYKKKGMIKE